MPLPDLIEIVPLAGPVRAAITVPGSKSITNRALILAALAKGETTLEGALWSEDTQVMVEALQTLGFEVKVSPDLNEPCNRTIGLRGLGGQIPHGGTNEKPLELFVGNAGTAARFLAALVCLGPGAYRLRGVPRMHERPQAALFQALRGLGYTLECAGDRLPAVIHGIGPKPGQCSVSISESSQFASALLLCANAGGWSVRVLGENVEESSYVQMTRQLIRTFPKSGGAFPIEPDASSGSYFWAAGWLYPKQALQRVKRKSALASPDGKKVRADQFAEKESPSCRVRGWPKSGWQIDSRFPKFLPLPATLSRQSDLGDSIMTAIVLAPFSSHAVRFTDLGRLRLQECERVLALRTELTKCGAEIFERGDELQVFPSRLHGAEVETYNDHRVAMCFAILGLKVPGITIKNPACVKKTFPNFFQKLATPPPAGLGATILDAATRRPLGVGELFAA
ncbi:MAG: 3-phosphoshikimate 1-carboxyvinyltransferase [Verrucomicrobia bacterium]|nr:3-phosphoshikimate 1-carboxyvinyltransferase [Verrucomicrobiota bacterium]